MQATLTIVEGTFDKVKKALEPTGCKVTDSTAVSITVSGNPVQVRNAARVSGVIKSAAIPEGVPATEPTHGTQPPADPAASDSVPPAAPAADNAPDASEGKPDATPDAPAAPGADKSFDDTFKGGDTSEDVTAPDASEDAAPDAADTDAS